MKVHISILFKYISMLYIYLGPLLAPLLDTERSCRCIHIFANTEIIHMFFHAFQVTELWCYGSGDGT